MLAEAPMFRPGNSGFLFARYGDKNSSPMNYSPRFGVITSIAAVLALAACGSFRSDRVARRRGGANPHHLSFAPRDPRTDPRAEHRRVAGNIKPLHPRALARHDRDVGFA